MWLPAKRQSKLGRVTSYNGIEKEHSIEYEDGNEETLYLAIESYQLQGRLAACMFWLGISSCQFSLDHLLDPFK